MDSMDILKQLGDAIGVIGNFVIEYAFPLFLVAVAIVGIWLITLVVANASIRHAETDARDTYCYEQGYNEAIRTAHEPFWYCFDGRREETPITPIPEDVWKQD